MRCVFSGSTLRDVIIHLQKQLEQALLRNRNLTQVTRYGILGYQFNRTVLFTIPSTGGFLRKPYDTLLWF
jgi:hypothetical protein